MGKQLPDDWINGKKTTLNVFSDLVNLSIVRLPQHLMNKASSFHYLKIWAQCKVVVATQMIKAYSFFVKKF